MKIISWNVNGIRAVIQKDALASVLTEHQPDIICFQETKADQSQVPRLLPEYHEYWSSADKKGYSGTAIFTKQAALSAQYGLPEAYRQQYQLSDQYGDTTKEGRVVTLEFQQFYISTVYTPNAKDDLSRLPVRQQWDRAYRDFVTSLEKQKPVIMCGDFNVAHTAEDLARPKENEGKKGFTTEERSGFDALLKAGFVDTFRQVHSGSGFYTWWSHWGGARARNVGWRIDYVLLSAAVQQVLQHADIHPATMGSDHCPVSIEIDMSFT